MSDKSVGFFIFVLQTKIFFVISDPDLVQTERNLEINESLVQSGRSKRVKVDGP